MFGFTVVKKTELNRLKDAEKTCGQVERKLSVITDRLLSTEEALDNCYSSFKIIAEKALLKSEGSFMTLADNIFYLALKKRPDLLKRLKDKVIYLEGKLTT